MRRLVEPRVTRRPSLALSCVSLLSSCLEHLNPRAHVGGQDRYQRNFLAPELGLMRVLRVWRAYRSPCRLPCRLLADCRRWDPGARSRYTATFTALPVPRGVIGVGGRPRGRPKLSDFATRAPLHCSHLGPTMFTVARPWASPSSITRRSLQNLRSAHSFEMSNMVAWVTNDRATSRWGRAVLQNTDLRWATVKTPECQKSNYVALLCPSEATCLPRARLVTGAKPDRTTWGDWRRARPGQ